MSEHSHSAHYFVPAPSRWPPICAVALLLVVGGFIMLFNAVGGGALVFAAGLALLFYVAFAWWRDVAHESETGKYQEWEDMSFRWGMGWFIFSEVMFFGAFFGALFYARALSIPDLGSAESKLLWPNYDAVWPTAGPHFPVDFQTMSAFGIPAINTLILLTSGATLTWAHWALKIGNRTQLNLGMMVTIALGLVFLSLQAYEYIHAYSDLNLRMDSGIYGSTFFMLTGFHGLHVTVGTIGLICILGRCMAGHFSADNHFGFEAVAWYWHFVDVVWLLLFVLVYWL